MSKQKVRTDYDRSAFCYEKRYTALQWEKYEIMIDIPLEGRILDLGCGTGLLASFLYKNEGTLIGDYTIFGVDISLNMLQRAKPREAVIQADIDFLPFRNNVFDVVLSFTSLQNLPSLDYVFTEVRRVLKPGHPFIFSVLQKEDSPLITKKVGHFFTVSKRVCGEDVGFICI
ncbi:MAG: class I SAM-dependent methyltransferase [Theionarchaea archaeon]|nr:class I SAM-dependent methyltransferase [Theionarchaea archaeon]